jgi:gamma-glutamyl-gamma-aminobutyrate hydrolase PuuD
MKRKLVMFSQIQPSCFSDLFDEYIYASAFDWNKADDNTYVAYGGGTDIHTGYYHEQRGQHTSPPDIRRDAEELGIFKQFERHVGGFIGICRGSQLLTVANGGSLFQNVSGHTLDHFILTIKEQHRIRATSTHHQMMNPFKLPSEAYQVIAKSEPDLSDCYHNGLNFTAFKPPLEPEIVYYPRTNSLAVQGHPEYLPNDHEFPIYFRRLIKSLILKEEVKNEV